jgi:thiamine-phosphate pyrophosphorylase
VVNLIALPDTRLCVICDADVCERAGWALTEYAAACFDAGARFVQIRAKALPGRAFLDHATAIVERSRQYGALVVVNDRADIARLAAAGGVHVGQDDLGPAQVRAVAGTGVIVGLSTHTPAQLETALASPIDYAAIGPVYSTATKATGYERVGLERVREASRRAGGLPIVGIGGITLERAPAVIGAGAAAVAVIGDLLATGDPRTRVRAYLDVLDA